MPEFSLQFLLFTHAHIAFYVTLLGIIALVRWRPQLAAMTRTTILRSSVRGFFSSANESPKFALLRIILGIMLVWRAYDEWILLTPEDMARPEIYVMSFTNLLTGAMLYWARARNGPSSSCCWCSGMRAICCAAPVPWATMWAASFA